jgi:Apolipoprotein N-acyltransferase
MKASICAGLTALAMYFSMGLGGAVTTQPGFYWLLALLAPVPALFYVFSAKSGTKGFLVAFLAALAGAANILPAYLGTLPPAALILGVCTPALSFALSAAGARFVAQRIAPVSAVVAFAALWTAMDWILAQGMNGAAASPAYAEIEQPMMIQIASLAGPWGITAVLGLFAGALAMALACRSKGFALLAAAAVAVNCGYGYWRIASAPAAPLVHIGLAASDGLVADGLKSNAASAQRVTKAYAAAGRSLAANDLIVFPEKIAVADPAWRAALDEEFARLGHIGHALIVAGFDDRGTVRTNAARIYFPNGSAPQTYAKRKLVPGLEDGFVPGAKSFMLSDRTGVAICKDMDFPAMLRSDAILGPNLYAVPAWDFDRDAVWHARLAILRGVENGFAVARAANNGLLTLSDAYGRVIAVRASAHGMVTLQGAVPRGPGATLYGAIGDGLAYIAMAMAALLLTVAGFAARRRPA